MKKKIIFIFVIWRVLLFLPLYFGEVFLPYRFGQAYTNLWYYIKPYLPVSNFLIFPWANFDGVHYLNIAGNGYTTNARFLPLFPLLIRFVSQIFGQRTPFGLGQFMWALILSNLFFMLSLIVFYKLIRLDHSEKISFRSLIFLLIFPTSFFFVAIYSESLFLLLTLLSFYFARKKNWLLASLFGLLLTITRLPGIIILPALFLEYIVNEKKISKKMIPLFFIPLGILNYGWFNLKKWGDVFYFIKAHGELANSRSTGNLVFPLQTVYRYLKITLSVPSTQFEWWIALLELMTFFLISFLLYLAWRNKVRGSYLVFSILCFFLPVFSGTFSGLPRYVAILFPIFIVLSSIKNKFFRIFLAAGLAFLQFLLLMFFSRGYFIA